ncbi:MAG: hypothetical protein GTN80_08755 [Nitrososphaeria archaeon]|nr:hypothetical protein [Nitrososphaeria archaeon]NIN53258.1 hypothetical protein [Nitrososphaeria archaeon]NIQ33709.1 hypothetical protein [Nitrososphaeria archaeon]
MEQGVHKPIVAEVSTQYPSLILFLRHLFLDELHGLSNSLQLCDFLIEIRRFKDILEGLKDG